MIKQTLCFLLIFSLLTSCDSLRDTTEFDVNHSATFIVESNFQTPISFPTPGVKTNSEQTFENHDTKASLVEDVRLTDLVLTIIDPPHEDFSFLEEVHIYLNAEGLPEQEVAFKKNIPDNIGSRLELETTDVKLDAYLKKETYTIRTTATTDETLTQDIEIRADITFHVRAKTKIF